MSPPRSLEVRTETFPIRGAFVIARGSRTETTVVTVSLHQGEHRGWGECGPSAHYSESPPSATRQIESIRAQLEAGAGRRELLELLPAGAARNAIDGALWDLECKLGATTAAAIAGLDPLRPVRTVRTISVGSPEKMADEASKLSTFEALKLKLDGSHDPSLDAARVEAVRTAAPTTKLIVDANESWAPANVESLLHRLADLGVLLVEQPTTPDDDEVLGQIEHPIPVCADEAFHTIDDLDRMSGRYDSVNLKLDKTGGLTHALEAQRAARARGLGVMVGCMVGTSLGMAPGLVLAQDADFVDLDGPLLLERDREPALDIRDGGWLRPNPALWGG